MWASVLTSNLEWLCNIPPAIRPRAALHSEQQDSIRVVELKSEAHWTRVCPCSREGPFYIPPSIPMESSLFQRTTNASERFFRFSIRTPPFYSAIPRKRETVQAKPSYSG